jgi:hypothetical protein
MLPETANALLPLDKKIGSKRTKKAKSTLE